MTTHRDVCLPSSWYVLTSAGSGRVPSLKANEVVILLSSQNTTPDVLGNEVLRAMFDARKRVFVDKLCWDVPVIENTYEVDQFDTVSARYLILSDDRHRHRASARLLPTTGPHILGGLFAELCDSDIPQGPEIREITRFCIEPTLSHRERRTARNELITGLAEYALEHQIGAYTAVATRSWFSQICRFGWRCSALGSARRIGADDLIGLRIDIDGDTLPALTAKGILKNTCSVRESRLADLVS